MSISVRISGTSVYHQTIVIKHFVRLSIPSILGEDGFNRWSVIMRSIYDVQLVISEIRKLLSGSERSIEDLRIL